MPRLKNLYVVYDNRAQAFIGQVVHAFSPVTTIRGVTEAVNDGQSMIAQNPDDFDILHVASIDEENGQIRGPDGEILYDKNGTEVRPVTIARASALAKPTGES